MSMLPFVFRSLRPASWMDQQYKMMQQMDAIMSSSFMRPNLHLEWNEPLEEKRRSTRNIDRPFKLELNVKNFAPQEISVKTIDDSIVIEGKQEKKDGEGFVSRHFLKTFTLPYGHQPEDVISSLSADGVLTITAPYKGELPESNERKVEIEMKGEDDSVVEKKA